MKPAKKPKQSRSPLQSLMKSVSVNSLSNGNLVVTPVYRDVRPYTDGAGGGPGVFTRLGAADQTEKLINAHLRIRRKK